MKGVLNNERGSVDPILIACFSVIFCIGFLAIVIDSWSVSRYDRTTTRVIDDLNRDIYSMLDVQYTAFETGFQIEDDADAYTMFYKGLQTRFHLDTLLNPLPGSPIDGQVIIQDFEIIDETEVPYSDGYGRTMQFPGIIALVDIPIKTPLLGVTGTQRVLVTTEVYR